MDENPPSAFTLIDMIFQLFYVASISTGCYIGWKAGQHFLILFLGGCLGWLVAVCAVEAFRSRLRSPR